MKQRTLPSPSTEPRPMLGRSANPARIDDISLTTNTSVILDGRHIRRLPKEVVASLMRYTPEIPERDWAAIRVFVLDAVAAAAETASIDRDRALKIAAPFVHWAVNHQSLPQVAGAVFNRRVIDGYCESRNIANGSVASYRSVLLKLADQVAPAENPEVKSRVVV